MSSQPRPHNNGGRRGRAQTFVARAARLAWRAFRLRCPQCGAGGQFTTWTRMHPRCPGCGLDTERREQGYQVGAYMMNIIAAELLFLLVFLGVVVATWPDPPWRVLQFVAPALMLLVPVLTYPFSKTIFLAMDLAVRPPGAE